MPRLWSATIEAHRHQVRDTILETTATLVEQQGLRAVTMSQVAEDTGIGRATLYKYFPDVESILLAWHERQIAAHLDQLATVRDQPGDARERLHRVLAAYAHLAHHSHGHDGGELAAFLHRDERLAPARRQLQRLVRDLVADAAASGGVRDDVPADELATYCIHALSAARGARSKPALGRLVSVVLAGLDPPG